VALPQTFLRGVAKVSLDPLSSDFSFEVFDAEDGDPIIVTLSGELDIAVAPKLREALAEITEEDRDVLVDLEDLTFLDSTGISVLVLACKRIRSQGGAFSLAGMSDRVRRVLEVTSLLEFLQQRLPSEDGD
jgi:anti-sigma B factor antagonist